MLLQLSIKGFPNEDNLSKKLKEYIKIKYWNPKARWLKLILNTSTSFDKTWQHFSWSLNLVDIRSSTESNWVSCTVTDCNSRQDEAALRCTLSTAASIEMVWEASVASKVQACTWAESWSIHIYWPLHKKWSKRVSTVAISNRDTFVPTVRICKIHEHAK